MINSIISTIKGNKKKEAKDIILKEFFNYSTQKRAINKAAQESSRDQKTLVDRYNKLVNVENKQCTCTK